MKNILQALKVTVFGALVIVSLFYVLDKANPVVASIQDGQGYNATTTRSFNGTALTNFTVLRTGPSILGSFVITGAGTGIVNFYDATTTDITQRSSALATSSILIASFPASAAAGTYTFDVQTKYGILYEVVSGSVGTSTITTK